jgi:DNA-binding CsgD family transcriptional regulator
MSMLDPVRMPHQEACEKALLALEDVPQVAVLLREIEVEVEVPKQTFDVPRPGRMKHGLSGREVQILALAAEGNTNEQIGKQLFLSPMTIKSHLRRIFSYLEVNSRTAAVVVATKRGIL